MPYNMLLSPSIALPRSRSLSISGQEMHAAMGHLANELKVVTLACIREPAWSFTEYAPPELAEDNIGT